MFLLQFLPFQSHEHVTKTDKSVKVVQTIIPAENADGYLNKTLVHILAKAVLADYSTSELQ